MATIEITGPDDKGQYTVEVESDADEAAEGQGGAPDASTATAMPGEPAPGGDDSGGDQGNSITCASIKEVLQAVKQILQGEGSTSPQDMWNQEAAAKGGPAQGGATQQLQGGM